MKQFACLLLVLLFTTALVAEHKEQAKALDIQWWAGAQKNKVGWGPDAKLAFSWDTKKWQFGVMGGVAYMPYEKAYCVGCGVMTAPSHSWKPTPSPAFLRVTEDDYYNYGVHFTFRKRLK